MSQNSINNNNFDYSKFSKYDTNGDKYISKEEAPNLTEAERKAFNDFFAAVAKKYQANDDGNGKTEGVIVQNGESPAAIAQKFKCSVQKLLEANIDKVHYLKDGTPYFLVGEKIVIPRKIDPEEFAEIQKGRVAKGEAIKQYVVATVPKVTVTKEDIINNNNISNASTVAANIKTAIEQYNADPSNVEKLTAALDKIDERNVAYVLERIPDLLEQMDCMDYLGMDKNDVIEKVLVPLMDKAYGLELDVFHYDRMALMALLERQIRTDNGCYYIPDGDYQDVMECLERGEKIEIGTLSLTADYAKNMSLKDLQNGMNTLASLIRNKEERSQEKVQRTFDNANKLLSDLASMDKDELHFTEYNNWKMIMSPNPCGRYITVYYDKNNEIAKIDISYERNFDGYLNELPEVSYTRDKAFFYTNNSGSITSGYNFDEIKAYVEQILAKAQKEQ